MLALALALSVAAGDTTGYVVLNHGRSAGEMLVVAQDDKVTIKYHHYDRQRGPRVETQYRLSRGRVVAGETWRLPLYGPEPVPRPEPQDRFEVVRDSVVFDGRGEREASPYDTAAFYALRGTPYDLAMLVNHLLAQRSHSAAILPSGTAQVEIVADTTLRGSAGSAHVRFAVVRYNDAPTGSGVWLDSSGQLVASQIGWFITVLRGREDLLPAMRQVELAYRNRVGESLARALSPRTAGTIAIVNGDVFDSERGVMLPRTTVLVRGDRIVAVGPASAVQVPAGAYILDASGKTVMPGMWDMHTHLQHTSQSSGSLGQLANGITTVRDLASDLDVAVSHRDRSDAALLASPRVILGGFIEGPGHWAGPTEVIVSTEAQAREWVARYDSLGYRQIKLYNLVQQDLVPAIVDEAHRRGMRVSGHVPRGLSTQAAVILGFDEINHAAFLFSTFFPDSLYVPVMRAYSTVSQIVAPNVNVDGPEVTAMIDLFKQKGTVIDGTWNLWLSSRGAQASANLGIPNSATRSLAERSDDNYIRMLKRLFDSGVPIVPGTDGSSYNVELELYERAGIPAAQVLRIATMVPAQVMGEARDYGSLAPGKIADLVIVAGRPAEHVSDLRKVERVMRAGRLYEASALRNAMRGRRQ